MMKWLKRILVMVAVVLAVAIAAALVGLYLLRGTPEWYPQQFATAEEREEAAERAEHKFLRTLSSVADAHAQEDRVRHAEGDLEALDPTEPIEISFTSVEINAFFDKWSDFHDLETRYGEYLSEPVLVLREGRIILAGRVEELATVVSAHFEPRLDEQGLLWLRLVSVRGGRLPLPPALWQRYRERLTHSVRDALPELQQEAYIAPDGASNEEAINAAMTRLLLNVLHDEPAEPVVFMPVQGKGRGVPVRLTYVEVEPDVIHLTVQPMTRQEREALLQRLREPMPPAVAAARR
jgi:hypothetical protein